MALHVELRILKENHLHNGMLCHKGDIITVDPDRATRMIAMGVGEKIGVAEIEAPLTDADEESFDDIEEELDEDEDEI
jgi:hypothetical protein